MPAQQAHERTAPRLAAGAAQHAGSDTLVVADGREQIVQFTGREAMHAAQVARMAMPAKEMR